MKLYGIPNCDTVKKARVWLTENQHDFEWLDFKKNVLTTEILKKWIDDCGWEILINRQGTTWRKLDDAQKNAVIDSESAITLMLNQPSVIKRPVLERNGKINVGFNAEIYSALFN